MKSYKNQPRKKRYDTEKLPPGRRELVEQIMKFVDKRNITIEEFVALADPDEKPSVASLGNMRNPDYQRDVQTRTILRVTKIIAKEENRPPEEVFDELTKGFPKGKYQYQPKKNKAFISEDAIRVEVFTELINNKLLTDSEKEVSLTGRSSKGFLYNEGLATGRFFRHDLVLDYTESSEVPINYWVLDIFKGEVLLKGILKDFFYNIMVEGADENIKYSIVTDSETLFNEFPSINVPALKVHLSCILYKDGKFKENYMNTALDHSQLEKAGLTKPQK